MPKKITRRVKPRKKTQDRKLGLEASLDLFDQSRVKHTPKGFRKGK